MEKKIHIAYGFHVNCYHSYRGDTPDERGFGSDLRVIRGIIAALDELNAAGIPVKGTWDSENFFSLQSILPRFAPDILDGMRRRGKENGDENIIMGYSNGALGAMQPDELKASIELAVTNPEGSGLDDIFGTCARIVRPQEVMFTPSQVRTYNALGVKAVCLYYSCVPFDAFRTFLPPLDTKRAFNPLTFTYRGEGLTVIPTYSNADVCDAGCLRAWVKDLRQKQLSGEADCDLFLFINMDADAVFWESLDLPVIGNRLANTDGIRGLVKEVADLDYVVFDTPGGYLRTHGSAGEITFGQDCADGNFTGYASWAEKPYNRKIWTAIERSRAAANAGYDGTFPERVKLLSTTHFGLATPVLNVCREAAADALAAELTAASVKTQGPPVIRNVTGGTLHCVQVSCKTPSFSVSAEGLIGAAVAPMGEDSAFLMLRFANVQTEYRIGTADGAAPAQDSGLTLKSGGAELAFGPDGRVRYFTYQNKRIGGTDFLASYLTYGGKRYDFICDRVSSGVLPGGGSVRLSGRIELPGALRQGTFAYTFFTTPVVPGVFVHTFVCYPYTPERDAISTENSTLGRYTDMRWQEAAPLCLRFENSAPVSVIKRNFEGDISVFGVDSYAAADPENRTLDSFNNQLTAGLVGLTDGGKGLLLANARSVLNSMAHCPMRLTADGTVLMNPFGTFTGRQRHHWNRSKDRIPRTYTLIAPQGKSLAPSYNGSAEQAMLCLLPFEGAMPAGDVLSDLLAFADGAFLEGTDGRISPFAGENVRVRAPGKELKDVRIRSPLLGGLKGNVGTYVVRGVRAVAYIARRQRKANKR